MKSRITIEPLAKTGNMLALMEIFSQQNISLVAVGSMPCVLSIEDKARMFGAEDRTFLRGLSAKDYALGKNNKHLKELLEKALQNPDTNGVIVYCSCLDILTNFSEEEVLDGIANENKTPIEFLYRGPLVKRKKPAGLALKEIWEKWGITLETFKEQKKFSKTTVEVDFAKEILDSKTDENILLVSPGGCGSCLHNIIDIENHKVFNTRFDDIAFASFDTNQLVEVIEKFFSKEESLLLLGSAVIKVAGISLDDVCKKLCAHGYIARSVPTDGFKK